MNLEMYEALLKETAAKYSFSKINNDLNTTEVLRQKSPVCFLRHDIDFSPKNGLGSTITSWNLTYRIPRQKTSYIFKF